MTAYAIAHLQQFTPHLDVAEYIDRIGATFEPFGGRFLIHGTAHEVKEGQWPGHIVIIAFPDAGRAHDWWDSPAYQDIAPLRSRHIDSDIIIVDGVAEGYDPRTTAQSMREQLG